MGISEAVLEKVYIRIGIVVISTFIIGITIGFTLGKWVF